MSESTDPVAVYQQAVSAYTQTEQAIAAIATKIHGVHHTLLYQYRFHDPATPQGPHQHGLLDLAGWPTADQIQELVTRWHAYKRTLETTWAAVPAGRRVGLVDAATLINAAQQRR